MSSVNLPGTVTEIHQGAFSHSGVVSFTTPLLVSKIEQNTFYECTSLNNVTVSAAVDTIEEDAFNNCTSLTTMYMQNPSAPVMNSASFYYLLLQNGSMYVPCGSGQAYRTMLEGLGDNCVVDTCENFVRYNLTLINNAGGYFEYFDGENYNYINDTVHYNVLEGDSVALRFSTEVPDHIYNFQDTPHSRLRHLYFDGVEIPLDSIMEPDPYFWIFYNLAFVMDTDHTVEAVFGYYYQNATVTVVSSDTLLGSVTGGGEVLEGQTMTIGAFAKGGVTFIGWSTGSTENPLTFEVLSDITLTALFSTDGAVLYDTVVIHDTVYIHDTVVVGVDDVETITAKIYTSNGQVVVDGAEGNTVTLYDAVGRQLAVRRNENGDIRFDIPATGTYLVKVGNAPARKVVVSR